MKQRVGFARALVVEPKVLFLDEPFSALDVLTAENLRGEIDDLWNAGTFPAKSILIVTHNIEEAVFLADRVIVLGTNPGRVRGEVLVDMPRPHQRNGDRFKMLVEYLYTVMTNPGMDVTAGPSDLAVCARAAARARRHDQRSARTYRRERRRQRRDWRSSTPLRCWSSPSSPKATSR
jgi:NitT/TauT family transport system ATP-binding protein